MKSSRTVLAAAFVAVFLIVASLSSTIALAGGYGGKHGRFGHDAFLTLIHKLKLTDDQKATVAGILSNHLNDLQNAASKLAADRVTMVKAALSGDNSTIVTASGTLGSDVAALAQLHATITSEIITALTPSFSSDQATTLQDMQTKVGSHVDDLINARFTHLQEWIAKHSKSN